MKKTEIDIKNSAIAAGVTCSTTRSLHPSANARTKAKTTASARPSKRSISRSRADVIPLWINRWLVVADEDTMDHTAACAADALARTGYIYLMKGNLVELTQDDEKGAYGIRTLDRGSLASALERAVDCVAYDRKSGRLKPGPSAAQLASLIMIHRPYRMLPVLSGIVVGPAKRMNGEPITRSGYDEASGLYLVDVNADSEAFDPPILTGDDEIDALLHALE